MRKIEVIVLETGPDYLDKVESFQMEIPGNEDQAITEAIKAVRDRGYQVLHDDQGGNNAYVTINNEKEYIAITIVPKVEEEEEWV
jgi:ABC-type Zn2+ transport system substrate-binding protein/surface adhesin